MIIVIIIYRYHNAFVWTVLVETCINSIHCHIIIIISWAYRYISLFDGTTAVTRCLVYIIIIWILACNGLWRHRQRRDGSKLCCTLVRATRRESWYLTPSRVKSRPSLFFFSFFSIRLIDNRKPRPPLLPLVENITTYIYIYNISI